MSGRHGDANASRQFHLPAEAARFQETYENSTNGIHVALFAAKRLCIVKTRIFFSSFFPPSGRIIQNRPVCPDSSQKCARSSAGRVLC